MKKAVSILLAAALILCMGVPVYAESITANQGTASSEVTGTYVPGTAGGTVFSVEITWSGLSFTYNGESKQVWNPNTLEYTGVATPEGWAESNAAITVSNRSNTIITATPNYAKEEGYTAGMNFSTDKLYVLSAEPTGEATTGVEKSGSITVTPTGTLPEDTQNATIGTITVTIGEFADITEDGAETFVDYVRDRYSPIGDIVLCLTQEEVDAVESGQKYVWTPSGEKHSVETYDGYYDKAEWALAEPLYCAMQDFRDKEITQDVFNQVYIDSVVYIQNLEILVKE